MGRLLQRRPQALRPRALLRQTRQLVPRHKGGGAEPVSGLAIRLGRLRIPGGSDGEAGQVRGQLHLSDGLRAEFRRERDGQREVSRDLHGGEQGDREVRGGGYFSGVWVGR